MTHLSSLFVAGVPITGGYVPGMFGRVDHWFVDADTNAPGDGKNGDAPFATIQAAVDAYEDDANPRRCGVIHIAPREENDGYDETVTISNAAASAGRGAALFLIGEGPIGSVFIQTTTSGAEGMSVSQNNVTLINLGIEAEDDADYALRVFGARFRAFLCKFEGPTADVVRVGPQTVALGAASGVLTGGDVWFVDCEFAWGGSGLVVTSSDYGACTELYVYHPRFHDLTVVGIGENDAGVIGAGQGMLIERPRFQVGSDGSAPTDWIDLNSAGSTGLIISPMFEDDTFDSATVQLATGVKVVDWHTEDEGAPSTGGTTGRPD